MHDMVRDDLPEWLRKAPVSNPDPRAAARALRPIIEAGAAEGEKNRLMPENVVRAIAEAGLWGLLVPCELGGLEADTDTYIDVISEMSYADGSVGWVMMATTLGVAGAAAGAGPQAIEAMYKKGGGYIAAGQGVPVGKAEKVDGGYRLSGTYQFGSGAQVASWMFGGFLIHKNGKLDLSPEGKPQFVLAFAPRSKVNMRGNWDVMGLAATASYDYEIMDQVLPADFIISPFAPRQRGGAIYDVPVAISHAAWCLGIGRRTLDELKALAAKKRRPNRATLIDQPAFQRDFAKACGDMEAARAYVHKAFKECFDAAKAGKPPLELRAHARLAASWATEIAADVGRFAYLAAGSDGLRNNGGNNVLQRCFRDLQAAAIHKHVDDNVVTDCGTVFLGVNVPTVEM